MSDKLCIAAAIILLRPALGVHGDKLRFLVFVGAVVGIEFYHIHLVVPLNFDGFVVVIWFVWPGFRIDQNSAVGCHIVAGIIGWWSWFALVLLV